MKAIKICTNTTSFYHCLYTTMRKNKIKSIKMGGEVTKCKSKGKNKQHVLEKEKDRCVNFPLAIKVF